MKWPELSWLLRASALSLLVGAGSFVLIALGLILAVLVAGRPLDAASFAFFVATTFVPVAVLMLWVRAYLNANRRQLRKALLGDLRPLLASAISLPVLSGFLAGVWVRFNLSGFLLLAYLVGVATGAALYYLLAPRKSWVSQVLTHLREAPPSPHTKPAES